MATYFNLNLIRHGQTEVNLDGSTIGQTKCSDLTNFGIKQAKALGSRFIIENVKFDKVYSSTYDRAYKTAKLALPHYIIDQVDALREYDAGDWLGAKRTEIMTESVKLQMGYLDNTFKPPNGESFNQVERRASEWLEDTLVYNKDIINQVNPVNVAVFSHGMTIKCLLHYIMGFDKSFTWKIQIDNTSITKLSFGSEGWKLLGVNDCSHLNGVR